MNPETVPLDQLAVWCFCSHKPEKYPTDRKYFACFSNWYPSSFELTEFPEGTTKMNFSSMEQWLIWKKARTFGDSEIAKQIMETDDPATIKKLGRQVRGYVHHIWVDKRYAIAVRGVLAKFSQNESLKKNLQQTGSKTIAEAATYDTVWSCGLHVTDPDTQDQSKWKGENLLGQALMEVRDTLMSA
jgi:ribA/ribD-fused uncharacterized protein